MNERLFKHVDKRIRRAIARGERYHKVRKEFHYGLPGLHHTHKFYKGWPKE